MIRFSASKNPFHFFTQRKITGFFLKRCYGHMSLWFTQTINSKNGYSYLNKFGMLEIKGKRRKHDVQNKKKEQQEEEGRNRKKKKRNRKKKRRKRQKKKKEKIEKRRKRGRGKRKKRGIERSERGREKSERGRIGQRKKKEKPETQIPQDLGPVQKILQQNRIQGLRTEAEEGPATGRSRQGLPGVIRGPLGLPLAQQRRYRQGGWYRHEQEHGESYESTWGGRWRAEVVVSVWCQVGAMDLIINLIVVIIIIMCCCYSFLFY